MDILFSILTEGFVFPLLILAVILLAFLISLGIFRSFEWLIKPKNKPKEEVKTSSFATQHKRSFPSLIIKGGGTRHSRKNGGDIESFFTGVAAGIMLSNHSLKDGNVLNDRGSTSEKK